MNDLRSRFRALDDMPTPNLWHEIEERAVAAQQAPSRLPWVLFAVALILALALGGAALIGSGIVKLPAVAKSPNPVAIATPSPTPSLQPFDSEPPSGLLNPGTYTHHNVDRTLGTNLRFRVPAGWTWNGRYLSKGGAGPSHGAAIFFFDGDLRVYADPCHWSAAQSSPTGSTAADLMAALAAQPMRGATTPAVHNGARAMFGSALSTPGQLPGMTIELTVPANINFANCDNGQFRSWGPDSEARSHQGPGQRDLVWAVDVLTRERLIVDAAWFPDTPANVRSEIQAILGSMAVGHWG